ncbi:gag-pol, partial [Mucuna pruriens]
MPIQDDISDEQLLWIDKIRPWYANICNFLVASIFPLGASRTDTKKLKSEAKYYVWDDPYLWRFCNDQIIRRCIPDPEIQSVLHFYHSVGGDGHYGSTRTARKPTIFQDAHQFVLAYKPCQRIGMVIGQRHEMSQQPILFCEVFDVWDIDFIGPFPIFEGNYYVLLLIDYILRWVEAKATKTNNAKVVVSFLKSNIFCRFGVPKALISDQGSHFYHKTISILLEKYEVIHQVVITYHSQTNGQAEVFNREIKKLLQNMLERLKPTLRGCSIGSQGSLSDTTRNVSLQDRLW